MPPEINQVNTNDNTNPTNKKVMLEGSKGGKYPNRVKYGKDTYQGFVGENINGDPVYENEDGDKRVAGDIKGNIQRDDSFNVDEISVSSRASASVLYTASEVDAALERNRLSANQNNPNEGAAANQNENNTISQGYDYNNNNSFDDGPPAHFAEMNNTYNDGPPAYLSEGPDALGQDPYGSTKNESDSTSNPSDSNLNPSVHTPASEQSQNQGFSDDPYDQHISEDEELANEQHHANQQTVPIRDADGNVIGVTTIDPNAANNAPMDPADLAEIERQMTDGDRLSRLHDRLEFMESLRLSTGVNPDARFHKNMSSVDAHDQLEKIRDGILDMSNKGLVGAEDSATANKFISGMIDEVAGNPSSSLDSALMSERVISDEDFNHPSTQGAVSSFRDMIEGKEDALLASLFLADIKSKGEYPFVIDTGSNSPISKNLSSSMVQPLDDLTMASTDSMRDYVEVKFAHEHYDSLSDDYKNGVTKQELATSIADYNDNGYFKRTRETNRDLENNKSPAQDSLFGISGVPISDPEALDSVMAINDAAKEGSGPFSSNSANPQIELAHVVSAKRTLDYQLENASYLPKALRAPYNDATISNTLHQLDRNHDSQEFKEQYNAIKEKGMSNQEWEQVSTPHKITAAHTDGVLDQDNETLRTKIAFHIKNYDQLSSFNDQMDKRGQDSNYPSQSELRLALDSLNDISQSTINPDNVIKLHDLNPPSPNNDFSADLDFKQSDADKIFAIIDTQLERPGMSDKDVINLDELSDIIEAKGFVKTSDYESMNSNRLDGVATLNGNTLAAAKLSSLSSHRSPASNGVAANLGAGSDVSKQAAAGDAHDIALSRVANAIIDGVVGDSDPKKTASNIQSILSAPELQAAAGQVGPQQDISSAQPSTNSSEPSTNDNTVDNSTTPSTTANDDTTPNPSESDSTDTDADESDGDDEADKDKEEELDNKKEGATRKQASTELPPKPQGGDYLTGGAGVLAALGALTSSIAAGMRGAIEPPHPSTYKKDYYKNAVGGPNNQAGNNNGGGNNNPSANNGGAPSDNRSSKSKLNPNTRNHLVTMQTSILAFETSSKLLEDNKISNTLSMQDKRLLEKDLKKQLSVFGNSSELASEGLKSSAPDMSSGLRLDVSDHLSKSSKEMKSLFDNSQDKGLFSANDRQKEIMENAMGAIGGAVTSLRNSLMVGIKSFFSPSKG